LAIPKVGTQELLIGAARSPRSSNDCTMHISSSVELG
jgi:hypothetical protein